MLPATEGKTAVNPVKDEELKELLLTLTADEALEVLSHNGDCYIPYMMNDAVEYYILLADAVITGSLPRPGEFGRCAFPADTEVNTVTREDKNGRTRGLILRSETCTATVWYKEAKTSCRFFRYADIGHFWTKGAEHWRQLVYITGTLYDKYLYLGDQALNEKEKRLLPLVTFPPFRDYSPVSWSLNDQYPATVEGFDLFARACDQTGNYRLARMIRLTKRFLMIRLPARLLLLHIRKRLNHPSSIPLYLYLRERIREASASYEERTYAGEIAGKIRAERDRITRALIAKGYRGTYPAFRRGDTTVLSVEEFPFTVSVLDYDDFSFRCHLLVSEARGDHRTNAGFFRGRGRRGLVLDAEKDLKKIP